MGTRVDYGWVQWKEMVELICLFWKGMNLLIIYSRWMRVVAFHAFVNILASIDAGTFEWKSKHFAIFVIEAYQNWDDVVVMYSIYISAST